MTSAGWADPLQDRACSDRAADDKSSALDAFALYLSRLSEGAQCPLTVLSVEQAAQQAMATWNREPLFHISSPLEGWNGPNPQRHHDFIDVDDFPKCWRRKSITVEVEAKAKEVAVLRLSRELATDRSGP